MKKNVLFSLLFMLSAAMTFGQQTTMTLTTKNGYTVEKSVHVFDDGSLTNHIEAIEMPDNVKEKLKADMAENYAQGEAYVFSTTEGQTTYTFEVGDGASRMYMSNGDQLMIKKKPNRNSPQILASGSKAFLGVSYDAFNFKEDAARKNVRGVVVKRVVEGEAAFNAGLEEGDVIMALNGVKTPSPSLFQDAVNDLEPRDEVVFTVNRAGKEMKLESIAGKRTMQNFWQGGGENILPFQFNELDLDGLSELDILDKFNFDELEGQLKDMDFDFNFEGLNLNKAQLGVTIGDDEKGVLITSVEGGTGAADAGLQSGDVITKVDGKNVKNSKELIKVIQGKEIGDKVKIQYLRKGKKKSATAELKKSKLANVYFLNEEG